MTLTEGELQQCLDHLPALSGSEGRILDLLDDPALELPRLERALSREPALLTRVLQLANSPFFGRCGRVSDVHQACLILGISVLRNLVLAVMLQERFRFASNVLSPAQVWRHSMVVAAVARIVARRSKTDPESAATAGMLHDLGKLALARFFPDKYRAVLNEYRDSGLRLHDVECAHLGISHACVGARLAHTWRLPQSIVSAVARHHEPDRDEREPLVDVIHVAHGIGHRFGFGADPRLTACAPRSIEDSLARLGLDEDALATVTDEMAEAAQAAARQVEE